MLLAIDSGNTNTVFAVFDGDDIVAKWRICTEYRRTSDELALSTIGLMRVKKIQFTNIDAVIISNVVPETKFSIQQFCHNYLNCEPINIGDPNIDLGIEIHIERPKEVGADRLVNAIAAYQLYGGDIVIVDFGTATTFDVIDEKGNYLGGAISPGINLSLDALHIAAAKLPKITIERPNRIIAKSTIEAMQSGIFWGYVGLIEGIVGRMKQETGRNLKTIITGGLAPLFFNVEGLADYIEPDLTLIGLKYVAYKNKK